MGADGGTKALKRKYLRSAKQHASSEKADKNEVNAIKWRTCAVSDAPLCEPVRAAPVVLAPATSLPGARTRASVGRGAAPAHVCWAWPLTAPSSASAGRVLPAGRAVQQRRRHRKAAVTHAAHQVQAHPQPQGGGHAAPFRDPPSRDLPPQDLIDLRLEKNPAFEDGAADSKQYMVSGGPAKFICPITRHEMSGAHRFAAHPPTLAPRVWAFWLTRGHTPVSARSPRAGASCRPRRCGRCPRRLASCAARRSTGSGTSSY